MTVDHAEAHGKFLSLWKFLDFWSMKFYHFVQNASGG